MPGKANQTTSQPKYVIPKETLGIHKEPLCNQEDHKEQKNLRKPLKATKKAFER